MALQQQNRGFEVTVVDDGEPALAYLSSNAPFENAPKVDLVVLDLNLPRLDGIAVLSWIRSQSKTAELPVFVLSSSPADAHGNLTAKATKYLEKPGTLDEYMSVGQIVADYLYRE
jgi:two-component system, chemotaxis family, response regulator Rcp1